MKKILCLALALLMVAMLTVGCGSSGGTSKSNPTASGGEDKSDSPDKIVFICNTLGDMAFNDSGWKGTQEVGQKYGYEVSVIELSTDTSTYEATILDAAESGNYDYIVTKSNWGISDVVFKNAVNYPDIKWIVVDLDPDAQIPADNITGIAYKQNEGSYLAGYAAAAMSKTGYIGGVSDSDIPIINDFFTGYIAGAKERNPDISVTITYGGDNSDVTRIQEVASAMFDAKMDIIYQVAGSLGVGVFNAAINHGGMEKGYMVVGVDTDQWTVFSNSDNPQLADVIFTSMEKRVGDSIITVFDKINDDTIKWGELTAVGIKEGSVDLADNEFYRKTVPAEIRKEIETLKQKIIDGELTPKSYFDFKDYAEFDAYRTAANKVSEAKL